MVVLFDPAEIRKILIINLAFIGDVLLSTPVARALHAAYPAALIDMMTVPLAAPVAQRNPYVHDVLIYDKRGKHRKLTELWRLIRRVRRERYDLAVTTNFASRGAILSWAAGIPRRVGYDIQHGGLFLTHVASAERTAIRHESENDLDVLKPLGITADNTVLELCVLPGDIAGMKSKVTLPDGRPRMALCPVGSYPLKSWTTAGYAALLQKVSSCADCFLIGSAAEQSKLEEINAASGNVAAVLAGTLTLGELAAFLKEMNLLVSVDTGPMHIANAVGTPVVALFGPTDPRVWGPRGSEDRIFYSRTTCSPCWGKNRCDHHECMETLPAGEVIAVAEKLLGKALI